jgi:multiple sugar transport system substrate-binding protein
MRRVVLPVLAALGLILAGCQQTVEAGRPVVRVTNWGGAGDDGEYDRLIRRFNRDFEAEHGARLKVEGIPDAYVPKMLLHFVAGTQPDVMVLDASSAAVFINNGLLTDLRPLIESDPNFSLDDYHPNVVDIARRGEAVYAIPGDFTPMVLYYNKDLFDAAGVPYPEAGWNFDDFLQTAKRLTIPGDGPKDPPKLYGFSFSNWVPGWIMWLWNNGGDVLAPDGSTAIGHLDSPQNVETITFLRDLVNVHRVAPSLRKSASLGVDLFANGQAAMAVSGHWALIGYKNPPRGRDGKPRIDWRRLGVVELPHNTPRSHTVIYEAGYAIPKDVKNPRLAWEYVKMWTGYRLQREYNQSGIAVSARLDVSSERAEDEIERQFLDIVPTGRPPHGARTEGFEVVERAAEGALDSILNNGMPIDQALRRAAQRVDREFAKRR